MDHTEHLHELRSESARIAAVARRDLQSFVLHCHPWRIADLVRHTGIAQRSMAKIAEVLATGDGERWKMPMTPGDCDLVDWFLDGATSLEQTLVELDPTGDLGKRNPDRTVDASLYRHIARETSIHRWDAEAATGKTAPLRSELAIEWLDGLLTSWLPFAAGKGRQAQGPWRGERFLFQQSDGTGQWLVAIDAAGTVTVEKETQGRAEVTARGSASDLLLLALNRLSPGEGDDLLVTGRIELFKRWRSEIRFGSPAAQEPIRS